MSTDGEIRELNAKMAAGRAHADNDSLRAEIAHLQERVEKAEAKGKPAACKAVCSEFDSHLCLQPVSQGGGQAL